MTSILWVEEKVWQYLHNQIGRESAEKRMHDAQHKHSECSG